MDTSLIPVYKAIYRRLIKTRLSLLSTRSKAHKSRQIARQVCKHSQFKKVQALFVYVGFRDEVDTREIIQQALKRKKGVWVPKVDPHLKTIRLGRIRSLKDLKKGHHAALEPKAECMKITLNQPLELFIVPGLAFDRSGRRLGRGEGYFDRFLKDKQKSFKMALAFQEQLLDEVPCLSHDIRMNEIITD